MADQLCIWQTRVLIGQTRQQLVYIVNQQDATDNCLLLCVSKHPQQLVCCGNQQDATEVLQLDYSKP